MTDDTVGDRPTWWPPARPWPDDGDQGDDADSGNVQHSNGAEHYLPPTGVLDPAGRSVTLRPVVGSPKVVEGEPRRLPAEPPADLADEGRALWVEMAAAPLRLWPMERSAVLSACRALDTAARLAVRVAEEGDMLPWGPNGTMRAHPLLDKVAEYRGLAARLLRSVDMPKESGAPSAHQRSRRGVPRSYRSGEVA